MSLKSINRDIAHKIIQSGINGVRIIIPKSKLKAAMKIPIRSQITIIKKILYFFLKSRFNPEKPIFLHFRNFNIIIN
jgi:hypothetical protein